MTTIYSRKDGLSWCGPPAEPAAKPKEASARPASEVTEALVPAFVVRKMDDGTLDLVMLRIPEEEVEERLEVDLGAVPQAHSAA